MKFLRFLFWFFGALVGITVFLCFIKTISATGENYWIPLAVKYNDALWVSVLYTVQFLGMFAICIAEIVYCVQRIFPKE